MKEAQKVLFQFHKGTIKTAAGHSNQLPFNAFQFHKGTIKTPTDHQR